MWYFTWILGLGAALAFGIINVMWLEAPTRPASSTKSAFASASSKREATRRIDDGRLRTPPSDPEPTRIADGTETATLRQVAGAVFWSFFGVRKGRDMQQDAVTIKPLHVVIVGAARGLCCSCSRCSRWCGDHPQRRVANAHARRRGDLSECAGRGAQLRFRRQHIGAQAQPFATGVGVDAARFERLRPCARRARDARRRTRRDPPCRRRRRFRARREARRAAAAFRANARAAAPRRPPARTPGRRAPGRAAARRASIRASVTAGGVARRIGPRIGEGRLLREPADVERPDSALEMSWRDEEEARARTAAQVLVAAAHREVDVERREVDRNTPSEW